MQRRQRPEDTNPNYNLWLSVRSPFKLPQSIHRCKDADWELLECDQAGCLVCGRLHKCGAGCPLEESGGMQVCRVTGCCVKNLVFAEHEYVDTAAFEPARRDPGVAETLNLEQVTHWVHQALLSPEARRSLVAEAAKRQARTQAVFTRLARHYKATRRPVNLIALCTLVAQAMQGSRVPRLLDEERLERLVTTCAHTICLFCHRFLDVLRVAVPPGKLHGLVVGLLYLLRAGVWMWDSVEILPRVPELRVCLPLENQLHSLFGLSTKVVTESENVIKLSLRNFSRSELRELGFEQR